MALDEPLLHSIGVEVSAAGKKKNTEPAKKEHACSDFEQLIQAREAEGIWQFYRHENRNIKEIQVIDLLIQRLTYHAQKMSEQNAEYKVLQRLRDVGVELMEFQSRLHSLPLLKMFMADLEAIEGLTPLPTKVNMKNFMRAIDSALDVDIKIAEMEEEDDPEEQDPDEERETNDQSEAGEEEEEEQDEEQDEEVESEADNSEGAKEGKATAEDLLAKYSSARRLRQELKQLGIPVQCIGQQTTAKDLAKLLAETLNSNDMTTIQEFADMWWKWKGTHMLRESEVEPVRQLCPDVGRCLCHRLEVAVQRFDKYPACDWFVSVIRESMEDNHFGVLSFNFEVDDDMYYKALPEGMPWVQLGHHANSMYKLRLIEEASLLNVSRSFETAVTNIYSRTLPAFILKLTRMKAIMASQVAMTEQARNKVLAAFVTGGMAVLSFMMRSEAKALGVS